VIATLTALALLQISPAFRTIDGDTVEIAGETIRLIGIDAPEMGGRAACDAERQLAVTARIELAAFLTGGQWTIEREGEDRYGRTLARILVGGEEAGEHLIAAGLAVAWDGHRHDWCAEG